jgi:hypothetical protein
VGGENEGENGPLGRLVLHGSLYFLCRAGPCQRCPGRLISATVTQLPMQIKAFANRFAKLS